MEILTLAYSPIALRYVCALGASPIHKRAFDLARRKRMRCKLVGETPQPWLRHDSSPFRGAFSLVQHTWFSAALRCSAPQGLSAER